MFWRNLVCFGESWQFEWQLLASEDEMEIAQSCRGLVVGVAQD
jgi:hypothetical protein